MKSRGFTIVELLIVIVVIAILAAITIVAYNGIQNRANNTATLSAAKNAVSALRSYITTHDSYPATSSFCLTTQSGCNWSTNVPPNSAGSAPGNITAIASLPGSTPRADDTNFGIVYNYVGSRTFNGVNQPLAIVYFLKGGSQDCQLSNLTNSGGATMATPTARFTATTGTITTCVVSIIGP
ncbi:type II secretion system protein [Candidatus Saccharibacteria bacterium]|nr:type II secretion system protein [Candidatus Saccharibacteria bacterium]